MIKGIGLRKVEISNQEYKYYQQLIEQYTDDKHKGSSYFADLFETDDNGIIIIIKPIKSIPWEILFFVQNLMINQNLRQYDKRMVAIENKLSRSKK
ncbi:hypothetical protein LCGC14_1880920 [marine sediment metagenome]|uniref:Uncharacterized protein n=1 Tax=marine sediment metagenome TaxID=412755 RepID=A0A0F9G2B6_9ZZZZ